MLKIFVSFKMLIVNEIGGIWSSDKLITKFIKPKTKKLLKLKSQKLFKSRKLKRKKLVKSQNYSKSWNLFKFRTKEVKSSFLTFDIRIAFICLWLTFIKAPILQNFDSKYYI